MPTAHVLLEDFSIRKTTIVKKAGPYALDSNDVRYPAARVFNSAESAKATGRKWLENQEQQIAAKLKLHELRKKNVEAYQ